MSPAEIARRLREVAEEMTDIGTAMDYHGGFDGLMAQHGREMVGAALIAREWADEIAIAAAMAANGGGQRRDD